MTFNFYVYKYFSEQERQFFQLAYISTELLLYIHD